MDAAVSKKSGAVRPPKRNGVGAPMLKNKVPANVDVMRRALGVYGIECDEDAGPAELLVLVRGHLQPRYKTVPKEELAECSVCKEVSTVNETDFCPFCGSEGEEDEASAETPAESEGVFEEIDENIQARKEDLDKAQSRIHELERDIQGNAYDIGMVIKDVDERGLWKASGNKYPSLAAWIDAECKFKRAYAYRLLEVVKQFDRETYLQSGASKLILISEVKDEEKRKELLDAAKKGASKRELAARAKGKDKEDKKQAPKRGNEIVLLGKVNGKSTNYPFRSDAGRVIKAYRDNAYVEVPISNDVRLRAAPQYDKAGELVGIAIAFVKTE